MRMFHPVHVRAPWAAALTLVLAAGLAFPAGADPGLGAGVSTTPGRLEGEAYDVGDPGCDSSTRETERTRVVADTSASGGLIAFAPLGGCGFNHDAVVFPEPCRMQRFAIGMTGDAGGAFTVDLFVRLEGVVVAQGRTTLANGAKGVFDFDANSAGVIPAGAHALRIDYWVVDGTRDGNLRLDYVEAAATSPDATCWMVGAAAAPGKS